MFRVVSWFSVLTDLSMLKSGCCEVLCLRKNCMNISLSDSGAFRRYKSVILTCVLLGFWFWFGKLSQSLRLRAILLFLGLLWFSTNEFSFATVILSKSVNVRIYVVIAVPRMLNVPKVMTFDNSANVRLYGAVSITDITAAKSAQTERSDWTSRCCSLGIAGSKAGLWMIIQCSFWFSCNWYQ